SEDGAGGGENDFANPDAQHCIEKVQTIRDVVPKILRRILHRFADERVGGEMHDCIRSLLRQRFLDRLSILQIAFDKFGAGIDCAAVPFSQVIENRDAVAFIKQLLGANAANIAGASGNEDLHSRQNRRSAPLINPKSDSKASRTLVANSPPSPRTESS